MILELIDSFTHVCTYVCLAFKICFQTIFQMLFGYITTLDQALVTYVIFFTLAPAF